MSQLIENQKAVYKHKPIMFKTFIFLISIFTVLIYIMVASLLALKYFQYLDMLYTAQITHILIGTIFLLFILGWGFLYGMYVGVIKPSYESLKILDKTFTALLQEEVVNKEKLGLLHDFIQESLLDFKHSSLSKKMDISDQTAVYLDKLDELTRQNLNLIESKKELSKLVDELQRQQTLLKLEQAKTTAILNAIPNGLIASSRDGNIFLINQRVESMLGLPTDKMLGRFIDQILPICIEKEGRICEDMPIRKSVAGEINRLIFSYKSPQSKQNITVENTNSPIFYENNIIGSVDVLRDITQEQIVERAQKEFVALASHQLRTPITAINWNAELVLNEPSISPDIRLAVQDIHHENQRMEKLVKALLNLSRIDLGNIKFVNKEINLADYVAQLLKSMEAEIQKKNIQLQSEVNLAQPIVNDPTYLDIIIGNLVSNAIKYTRDNGQVSIKAFIREDLLSIQIKDNGIGIPFKQQSQIFGRLFRAENAKHRDTDGTGLGLYVVKKLVEAMRGSIWFESKEDKGTTFFVNLPTVLK